MRIDVFTIFPEQISAYCATSILGRAQARDTLEVRVHNLRDGSTDVHHSVDDSPYGGGAGMVLMPEPVFSSVESVPDLPRPLYLLSPGGRRFDQGVAEELAARAGGFSLLCGRYEGVDQRVVDHLADGELSVGDYVLAGGELAALVVVEAVARLLPGVLGNEDSALDDSFSSGLLEYPQYTRPAEFRDWPVPDVLRSGDHGAVAAWRRTQALLNTAERRPDLLEDLVRADALGPDDVQALVEHGYDVPSGPGQSEPQTTEPEEP